MTTTLERVREEYLKGAANRYIRALVVGDFGSGKTYSALTLPKPVLLHSFDPSGTDAPAFKEAVEKGDMFIETFSAEDPNNASEFKRWENVIEREVKDGTFNNIGSFVMDSLTQWAEYIMNAKQGRTGKTQRARTSDTPPEQRDYMIQQRYILDYIHMLTDLPCHFVMMAHKDMTKDEATGRVKHHVAVTGKCQFKVPALFQEVYQIELTPTVDSRKPKVELITKPYNGMNSRTRIGDGLFEMREPADWTALLKKAGLNYEGKKNG